MAAAATVGGTYFPTPRRSAVVRCCAAPPNDKLNLNSAVSRLLFSVSSGKIARIPSHINRALRKGNGGDTGAGVEVETEENINPYALAVQRPETLRQLGKSLKDYSRRLGI